MTRVHIKHVLCPVDLSEPSRHAYQHAIALARWFGAQVTLLEVLWDAVPPVPFDSGVPAWRGQVEEVREDLRRFAGEETGHVTIIQKVLEGPVVTRILEEGRRLPADLIVMGTHGTSGFEHLVLGSVTEKVLRKALCPVLTVPPALGAPAAAFTPFKSILCAVDFSAWSLRGLAYAASLAKESGGRLILVYVVDWPVGPPPFAELVELAAHRHPLEAEALRRLKDAVSAETRTWCETTEVVAVGKPHEEILRLAEEQATDAIVLGVHARSALSVAFFGSTANQVVRAATCPVLTVRA